MSTKTKIVLAMADAIFFSICGFITLPIVLILIFINPEIGHSLSAVSREKMEKVDKLLKLLEKEEQELDQEE